MTTLDHTRMRQAMSEQAAAFLADPAGWPAAMAARALRLRAGHKAYSPTNQMLIMSQLYASYRRAGLAKRAAIEQAVVAAAGEIAPRHVWRQRGYTPTGAALSVWSRPLPMWIDPTTGEKATKDTPGAVERRVFRIESTYLASDVVDADGHTAEAEFSAPVLPAGQPRDVFERLCDWINAQGWTVTRSGTDRGYNGETIHATKQIIVNGGLSEWAAVETVTHEIAHALLHGAVDDRPYVGQHRGDIEAEAGAVAYGLLTAFDQTELARGAARYAAQWTRSPERVAIAYEVACHVVDAVLAVALGAEDVTVAASARAERAQVKTENKALAAQLRAAGLDPRGEAWRRAKAGEPIHTIAADLAAA